MKEEMGMRESSEMQDSTATIATGDRHTAEALRGPGWRGWALSIIVAVALSVMATLLLGGGVSFRPERAVSAGGTGSGHTPGDVCCPPASPGR